MNILLHVCCAPCLNGTLKAINQEAHKITAYFYNPNIHPYQEFKSRLNALKEYVKVKNIDLISDEAYGLRKFVNMVKDDLSNRCSKCYTDRIYETAKKAKELGYDAFSSTLLVSPYQMHDSIVEKAREFAKEFGIEFFYIDPRQYFREGNNEARSMGVYMQKYCGCVFSEEERYLKKKYKK
ncbi:epoxyqueuosine reductase QueH [Candidatus Izemoplasma sp. B36]|uniref:epoxyqueuosine reductase QueH n=1 Tax=Candidatus Izemoplasma sp. B36 TaxID=3242468 RepID=UPI0035589F63